MLNLLQIQYTYFHEEIEQSAMSKLIINIYLYLLPIKFSHFPNSLNLFSQCTGRSFTCHYDSEQWQIWLADPKT